MPTTTRLLLRNLVLSLAFAGAAAAQTSTFTSESVAGYGPIVSPDSIAAGFGSNLATATTAATTFPLPVTLGNVQVSITDSAGVMLQAPLFMVSAGQINYLVPASAALGKASVTVTTASGATVAGSLLISNVSPALFTANMDGKGVPAAQVLRVNSAGIATFEPPFQMGSGSMFVTNPINLSPASDKVYLILYGTGIRRHSLNPVKATIGGVAVPVLYASAQSQYAGLDQVNLGPIPQSLAGKGEVDLVLLVDGVPANTVRVAFQ